jgi:hypothetical protein
MDEAINLGRGDRLFQEFAARYDVPAYVRRARRMQEAFDDLVARCRKQREEWLDMVRIHTRAARALAGPTPDGWLALLRSALDLPVAETVPASPRKLRQALCELQESVERFNCRWRRFLSEVDLTAVNELRDGYNRCYILEKECALRSARLARIGFQPMKPVTVEDLLALLPLLPLSSRELA